MLPDDAPYVAHKLEELGATAEELARLIGADPDDVRSWRDGTTEPAGPTMTLIMFISNEPGGAIRFVRHADGRCALVSGGASRTAP